MKKIILIILVLGIIVCSYYIVSKKVEYFNPISNLLLNILLTGFSIAVGYTINEERIKKEATAKWMPAAENACKELITVAKTVGQLMVYQNSSCGQMEALLASSNNNDMKTLKVLIRSKCQGCANELSTVKNHLNKSTEDWRLFLASNCEKSECEKIEERIKQYESKIA